MELPEGYKGTNWFSEVFLFFFSSFCSVALRACASTRLCRSREERRGERGNSDRGLAFFFFCSGDDLR